MKEVKDAKKRETDSNNPANPHKAKIEDEELGQSAVGKHTPTQRKQNEERDQRAMR